MTTTNLFTNRATAKLAVALTSGDSAVTLVPGGGDWFPSPGPNEYFRLVVQKGSGQSDQREYMLCTSRAGDVLTVTRAQEGTPAANFDAGDEASLVVTAMSFGEFPQKQGMVLQGPLEVEAEPTTPMGIANKDYVDATTIDDVPNDGKTYGRQFGLWDMLGDAAQLPIPIPIGAGGTGGISLSEAQLNLIIARTSIDDLAPTDPPPKYGDRWIKPSNMSEMVWVPNQGVGGVWINPADAGSEAYPIPITKGGTGATTVKQALINLGIADHDSLKVGVNATDTYLTLPAKAGGGHSIASLMKAGTGTAGIYGYGNTVAAPLARWFLQLGNGTPEAGSNAGSDFVVARYNDAGAVIDNPLSISRATGLVNFSVGTTAGTGRFGDGALASPSIAFIAEPGLGWYRAGGGIKLAQNNISIWGVSSVGSDTFSAQYARVAAGRSVLSLANAPQGTVNYDQINFDLTATQMTIGMQRVGSATAKPMNFTGASIYVHDNQASFNYAVAVNGAGGNSAQLILNKGTGNVENVLIGQTNGSMRWRLIMGDGPDVGLHWQRYNDAGVYAGTFMQVNRANGLITFGESAGLSAAGPVSMQRLDLGGNYILFRDPGVAHYIQYSTGWYWSWNVANGQLVYAGSGKPATVFLQNGDFSAGGNVYAGTDQTFGIVSNGDYPYIKFTSDLWRLQLARATGTLMFCHPNNAQLWTCDASGNTVNSGAATSGSRITSNSGDGAAFYAPVGGIRSDIANGSAFYAPNGGITISGVGSRGVTYSTSQNDGGWIGVYCLAGNPSWNTMEFHFTHQSGAWAGARTLGGSKEIQFIHSNATAGWGEIKAAAFTPQSDIRFKNDVRPLSADSRSIFMEITPIRWTWPEPEGEGPWYYDTLEDMGFSAQNLYAHLPLAVRGNPTAVDAKGNPISAAINPVPVLALTVHELQALIAHVSTLEARINQLETQ